MTDPRTSAPRPEDDAPRDEPTVDSFAREPEPELPDAAATPPTAVEPEVPLDAPEPATPQTLADEEPVSQEPSSEQPMSEEPSPEQPAVASVEQPVEPPPLEEAPVEPAPTPVEPPPLEEAPVEPAPAPVQPPPLEEAPVEAAAPAVPVQPAATPELAPEPESEAVPEAGSATGTEPETEPESEPESVPAAGPGEAVAGQGARRSWLPVVVLGAIVGLLLGGTGFAVYEWFDRRGDRAELAQEQEQIAAASREAMAASEEAATALFSYSHENLADDFEKGLAFTTGEFQEEYRKTTTEVVTPVAERYDAVVVAQVSDVGVVRASPDEVTTLVFLNQVTSSTRVTGQQVDQSRVRMRLVERDGRWLVEEVDAL